MSRKSIIIDIDGTLCPIKRDGESYDDLIPYPEMIERIHEYRAQGFTIVLHSARNMRTYSGNVGLITANTAKFTMAWLDRHGIPYDEIYFGKPWPGEGGFYVDDKAIRPNEFRTLSYDQIQALVTPQAEEKCPSSY